MDGARVPSRDRWTALAVVCLTARALVAGPHRADAQEVSRHQVSVQERLGGSSRVVEGGTERGRLSGRENELAYAARVTLSPAWNLLLGAGYRNAQTSAADAVLPSRLQALAVRLGAEWLIGPRWWAFANAHPGFYGDGRLDGDAVNAPADVQVHYLQAPGLRLVAGLSVDAFSGSPVTPFAGAVWRLNSRWNLNLLPPRLRVEYRAVDDGAKRVELFSGLSFSGASHRVSRDFGTRRARPELDGRRLTRREAAVEGGASLDWRGARAEVSAGWLFLRRFRYEGTGVELKADGAPYLAASVSGRW